MFVASKSPVISWLEGGKEEEGGLRRGREGRKRVETMKGGKEKEGGLRRGREGRKRVEMMRFNKKKVRGERTKDEDTNVC